MSEAVQIEERPLEELGERFAGLRLTRPRAEAAMERSLSTYGQISPVVCARLGTEEEPGVLELVDGFKRLGDTVVKVRATYPNTVFISSGDDDAEKTSKTGDRRGRPSGRGAVREGFRHPKGVSQGSG